MINFNDVTRENIKEHNTNWPQIPHHPYKIVITVGSELKKKKQIHYFIY